MPASLRAKRGNPKLYRANMQSRGLPRFARNDEVEMLTKKESY